jgi:DedD protein
MAERLAEPDDAAVDELKRKARRRLVGAVVLALAAAIVVPMLLEREPRPLGDEVSVQIPPIDEGRFVNRVAGAKSDAKEAAPSPTPPDPPRKSLAEAEQRVMAPPASAPQPNPAAPAEAPAPPAAPTPAEAAAPEPPRNEPSAQTPVAAAAPAGQFAVQVAAFTDDKGANALAGKLKRAGYPAYTEPVQTSHGTMWRVRVGTYASRDAASEARGKLKGDGYSGIVAAVNK